MDIIIETPIKARVTFSSVRERLSVAKKLTYTNTSVSYLLFEHNKKRWWKTQNPDSWQARKDELNLQLKDCLLQKDEIGYWIRPGSINYLENVNTLNSSVLYPETTPINWHKEPEFKPYGYQVESYQKLIKARHGNISLPTGAGKSFILLLLVQQTGLDAVIVTPSKSIFNELLTEFQARLGKHMVGGYGDGKKDIGKPVTIAIGKSLTMLKEDSDAYSHFKNKKVMAVDESHTFATKELEEVCHGVLSEVPYRFFVSATQTRNDGTEKLLESIIGKNVMTMELKDAISQGYLCPLKFTILTTFSPSTARIKNPSKCKRTHFLYNSQIAKTIAKIANGSWNIKKESTLILVKELKQIKMLIDLLEVPYSYVHSANKSKALEWGLDRVKLQDEVDKFNNGEVKVLIGTEAISTGTNIYPSHNSINWVGGGSEIATKQGVMGRSTRKLELSRFKDFHKEKLYSNIYDFNILGQDMLNKQLEKRIGFYQESGGIVTRYGK